MPGRVWRHIPAPHPNEPVAGTERPCIVRHSDVRNGREGESWGRDGGQGVLTFRSLLRSGRFDRAWAAVAPRLNRCGGWKPPQCANNNRPAAQVALAA